MKKLLVSAAVIFFFGCFLVCGNAQAAVFGDATGDSAVTAEDARLIMRVAVKLQEPGEHEKYMDVNRDHMITASDARLVLRRAVGLEALFEAEIPDGDPAERDLLSFDIDAPRAVLYCADDNSILYQKNIDDETASASLIKLLTALTALTNCNIDQVFTVGDEIDLISEESSICELEKGWQVSLRELLYGMLLPSGNDAAYCIAANVARQITHSSSPEYNVGVFVDMMNEIARQLGMYDTVVKTPDGFDEEGQYTTVRDLLTLARAAMQNVLIAEICSVASYDFSPEAGEWLTWENTNRFLTPTHRYYDARVTGLKGGFTDDAGSCLIASARVNETDYIIVLTGVENFNDRYAICTEMLDAVENG